MAYIKMEVKMKRTGLLTVGLVFVLAGVCFAEVGSAKYGTIQREDGYVLIPSPGKMEKTMIRAQKIDVTPTLKNFASTVKVAKPVAVIPKGQPAAQITRLQRAPAVVPQAGGIVYKTAPALKFPNSKVPTVKSDLLVGRPQAGIQQLPKAAERPKGMNLSKPLFNFKNR